MTSKKAKAKIERGLSSMTKPAKARRASKSEGPPAAVPPLSSPKPSKRGPTRVRCDYCSKDLGCDSGSPLERDYLQLQFGFIACDSCLPNIANDFPDAGKDRLLALRLRHTRGISLEKLDNAIESARDKIEPSGLHKLSEERQAIFWLHSQGELVASMHAGQALFNSVSHLMDHLTGEALVIEREQEFRTRQAKKAAEVKHEASNRARLWVCNEWITHRDAYDGNKSAFSRDYARRVLNEFSVTIGEKQMREVWLKDTPSAGSPAGLPADG